MTPPRSKDPTDPADRLNLLMGHFLHTIVFTWIDGRTLALTDQWASGLPTEDGRPVYVITADDPYGENATEHANRRHLRDLLRAVREVANYGDEGRDRWGHRPFGGIGSGQRHERRPAWWPAVGCSNDATHGEQSVLVAGITRADAVDLGRRFDQLAVFELTDDLQTVVPCIEGMAARSTPRTRHAAVPCEVTYAHLESWWAAHETTAREVGIHLAPRPRCRRCGSRRVARVSYGLPAGRPPPWIALGGCLVQPGNPHQACTACGLRD